MKQAPSRIICDPPLTVIDLAVWLWRLVRPVWKVESAMPESGWFLAVFGEGDVPRVVECRRRKGAVRWRVGDGTWSVAPSPDDFLREMGREGAVGYLVKAKPEMLWTDGAVR